MAEAIAEACAVSLTGDEPKRVSVSIGSTGPLVWPDEFVDGTGAVLIHGVNRSCLSSYGDSLRKLLTDRVLGRPVGQLPLLLGTLLDGPSTLPLGPVMTEYGPVFDTDCLGWDFRKGAADIEPGRCEATAWELKESPECEAEWKKAIDKTFAKPCVVWERIALAALKRLTPLFAPGNAAQPHASFAFAWLVPRYLAFGMDHPERQLQFPEEYPMEDLIAVDMRLSQQLKSVGIKE